MKDHPPPEATPQQMFLEDLDRRLDGGHQVTDAHHAGGYTAVLKLARERLDELKREFATLTAGHQLIRMTNAEREELRRTWTPEKARLNERIGELNSQIWGWGFVGREVAEFALNEAYGWTILPDLAPAKVLDNGKVLSTHGWVSRWEEDGQTYTSDGPDERWKQRHRSHALAFAVRVRVERLARVLRSKGSLITPRSREHRPGGARRAASSSTSSAADPPESDSEPPRRRGDLRHVSYPLTAFLRTIGGTR